MDLIYDVDRISSYLGRYVDLVYQLLNVVDRIVRGGVKLMDTVRPALLEADTGFTMATWLHLGGRMLTVDSLREDSRGAGLSHAPRATEKVGMGQLPPDDGILEGLDYVILSYQLAEGIRPIFSGRHYVLLRHLPFPH